MVTAWRAVRPGRDSGPNRGRLITFNAATYIISVGGGGGGGDGRRGWLEEGYRRISGKHATRNHLPVAPSRPRRDSSSSRPRPTSYKRDGIYRRHEWPPPFCPIISRARPAFAPTNALAVIDSYDCRRRFFFPRHTAQTYMISCRCPNTNIGRE